MPKSISVLGMMSGSSLDGLDLILVNFSTEKSPVPGQISFDVLRSDTLAYPGDWVQRLKSSTTRSMPELHNLHNSFGSFLGELTLDFLQGSPVDLIALHGHTVYHEPKLNFTFQLGSAQALADQCQFNVVSDFRAKDIALGGQGAPLAPSIEHWLLKDYQLFLNLGGIANLSYHNKDQVFAFDIGAANQLLNGLAQTAGLEFDDKGQMARKGKVQTTLLNQAMQDDFFHIPPPKSLSNQWVQKNILPLFKSSDYSLEDKLATACDFIAWQLQLALEQIDHPKSKLFITGGGAYNDFLIENISKKIPNEIIIPEAFWINQKESLLMALLGFLFHMKVPNVLGTATGSNKDHCAGNIYHPQQL